MGRLEDDRNIWVCTVRADGSPHLTPTWFTYVDGSFWIGTGADNVKTANVRERPRVAVSLEDGNDPLVAEGPATVVPRPYPSAVVDAFMSKYGWDVTREEDADVGTLVMWQIVVDRWLLGGPTD
jgi:PPOX class probable F420-dependent enzyme